MDTSYITEVISKACDRDANTSKNALIWSSEGVTYSELCTLLIKYELIENHLNHGNFLSIKSTAVNMKLNFKFVKIFPMMIKSWIKNFPLASSLFSLAEHHHPIKKEMGLEY